MNGVSGHVEYCCWFIQSMKHLAKAPIEPMHAQKTIEVASQARSTQMQMLCSYSIQPTELNCGMQQTEARWQGVLAFSIAEECMHGLSDAMAVGRVLRSEAAEEIQGVLFLL